MYIQSTKSSIIFEKYPVANFAKIYFYNIDFMLIHRKEAKTIQKGKVLAMNCFEIITIFNHTIIQDISFFEKNM